MSALRQFIEQRRAVQVLLLNELTIFPYLAVYFREHPGFSVWMVGLILGVRTLCQQGLTVIGGTLADRLGYKPLIIAGLGLRAAGFTLFGFVDSLGGPARRRQPQRPDRRTVRPRAARLSVGVTLLGFSFRVTGCTSHFRSRCAASAAATRASARSS